MVYDPIMHMASDLTEVNLSTDRYRCPKTCSTQPQQHQTASLVLQSPSVGALELQQPPLLEVFDNLLDALLDALQVAADLDLGVLGSLVGGGDAGELGDLALAGLLVEALGVTGLGDLEREVDVHLDEGQGLIVGVGSRGGSVEVAGLLTVCPVGGDERGDGDGGGVGEEFGNLELVVSAYAFAFI